jgi:hypothetical protein
MELFKRVEVDETVENCIFLPFRNYTAEKIITFSGIYKISWF